MRQRLGGLGLGGLEGAQDVPVDGQAPLSVPGDRPVDRALGAKLGDLGQGGQLDLLHARARLPLDPAQPRTLLGRHEGQSLARAAGPTRAAHAVDVGVGLARHVEVDDDADPLHVQPPRGDVGGHQDVQRALAQPRHELLPLLLDDVPRQRGARHAARPQFDGQILGRRARAHEHEGGVGLGDRQHARQGADLVPLGDDGERLVDRGDRRRGPRYRHLLGVAEVALGHPADSRGHGRREEGGDPLGGQIGGDGLDVVGEAHAQHLVGLVEDEVPHGVQEQGAAVHEVHDAARRPHHDLGAVLERAQLRAVGGAPVDGHDVQAPRPGGEGLDGLCPLHGQLARGGQDEGLDPGVVRVDVRQEREGEGRRLARARLRHADDVAPFEQQRDGRGLDGRGGGETEVRDGREEVFGQAEVGEVTVARVDVVPSLLCGEVVRGRGAFGH